MSVPGAGAVTPLRVPLDWATAKLRPGLAIWPLLMAMLGACTPPVGDAVVAAETCADPVATCVLGNGMSLQTRESPRPLTTLHLTLRDVPVQVTAVQVEASMAGMTMPPVSVALRNAGPSEWAGELILPVCSQGRSDWLWTLVTRVDSGERRTAVAVAAGG